MMSLVLPALYPITDVRISGLTHADQVKLLAKGGATWIQLRDKESAPRDFYAAARDAMSVARQLGVQIIINDRVDIALAVGAAGVHLGQTDLPPDRVRKLVGDYFIIGYSTHNVEQARTADSMPVDYVAVGPVFHTSTKEDTDEVLGLTGVESVRLVVSKPLVAIGGISLTSSRAVITAGADSVAVISDLIGSRSIPERTREFLSVLDGAA